MSLFPFKVNWSCVKSNNWVRTSDSCIWGCRIEIFFKYNKKNHISCDVRKTLIVSRSCRGIQVLFNTLRNGNFFGKGPLIRKGLKITSCVYSSISGVSIGIGVILSKAISLRLNYTVKHIKWGWENCIRRVIIWLFHA